MFGLFKSAQLPTETQALAGRSEPIAVDNQHFVTGKPILPPFPDNTAEVVLGLGCFWGAERIFWQTKGVYTTAVGYAGGFTENPTYQEVCSGETGHTEVVRVVYHPDDIALHDILAIFWQAHDPTQGMRQGNDVGTQYRSAIFVTSTQDIEVAKRSRDHYQQSLQAAGYGAITTEIEQRETFYYAEQYHQQYLAKNPGGYCGLGGTGVACPNLEPAHA